MKGVWLEQKSWAQAKVLLAANSVLLLPLGAALKEHGLHLPLNNDWLMAEALTRRVAERVDVVVLPTIQHFYYPTFIEYPGSVSLQLETSQALLRDICLSLARHQARKFYCLNTGISTLKVLRPLSRELLDSHGLHFEFLDLDEALDAVSKRVSQQAGGSHADEVETSIMLELAPQVVHMELAQDDYRKGDGPLTLDPANKNGVYSPTGAWGNPTLATREKGRLLVDALVDHIVGFIERLQAL